MARIRPGYLSPPLTAGSCPWQTLRTRTRSNWVDPWAMGRSDPYFLRYYENKIIPGLYLKSPVCLVFSGAV
jgi:hypothetical protein